VFIVFTEKNNHYNKKALRNFSPICEKYPEGFSFQQSSALDITKYLHRSSEAPLKTLQLSTLRTQVLCWNMHSVMKLNAAIMEDGLS